MDAIVAHSQPRGRWLQFSLRAVLLLVAFAAVCISLWISYRERQENRRLRGENKQLRNQLGIITIEDEDKHKVHAIQMPTEEPDLWKWRVYIPRGDTFQTVAKIRGQEEEFASLPLPAGEYVVELALKRDQPDEAPMWQLEGHGKSSSWMAGQSVSDKLGAFITQGGFSYGTSGVEESAVCVEPGEEMPLFSYKVNDPTAPASPGDAANEIEVCIRENSSQK